MKSENKQDRLLRDKLKNYQSGIENPEWSDFFDKFKGSTRRRRRAIIIRLIIILLCIVGLIAGTVIGLEGDFSLSNYKRTKVQNRLKFAEIPLTETRKNISKSKNNMGNKPEITVLRNGKTALSGMRDIVKPEKTNNHSDSKLDNTQQKKSIQEEPISTGLKIISYSKSPFPLAMEIELKNNEKNKSNTFGLSINFSPEYTFQKFTINNNFKPQVHEDFEIIRLRSEKGKYSFSAGVNLEWCPRKNFSISSGLFYSSFGTTVNYNFTNHKIPVIDSATNNIIAYLYDSFGVKNIYKGINKVDYLGFPLVFKYEHELNDKIDIVFETGAVLFINVNAKGMEMQYNTLELTEFNRADYFKLSAGLLVGSGVLYRLSENSKLGFIPVYKTMITNTRNDNYQKNYPYSFEIKLSYRIIF